MSRAVLFTLFLIAFASVCLAQVRVSKLEIGKNEEYTLSHSDILVADTLIMMDSSRLNLNKLKYENYIRAQVVIIGNHCVIDGKGIDGRDGRNGRPGDTPFGPCKDGENGRDGSNGLDGGPGIDLYLYFSSIQINGKLIINLSGGNGGKGGNGGNGGGGSPGTVHCLGGDGGDGGNGANGGSGGIGGTLNISCKTCPNIRTLFGKKIIFMNGGGNFGFAGIPGYGGSPGLGPSRKNGKTGERGEEGANGRSGELGTINFDLN
jgi:hypothetical protein